MGSQTLPVLALGPPAQLQPASSISSLFSELLDWGWGRRDTLEDGNSSALVGWEGRRP